MQSKSVVKQIITWAGLFKAKFVWPRVSVESDFRFDSFKRKFSQIIFVHNMILWCSKNNTGHYPKRLLNKGIKKPKLKFNLGLVLMGLQTTGPWSCKWKPANNLQIITSSLWMKGQDWYILFQKALPEIIVMESPMVRLLIVM